MLERVAGLCKTPMNAQWLVSITVGLVGAGGAQKGVSGSYTMLASREAGEIARATQARQECAVAPGRHVLGGLWFIAGRGCLCLETAWGIWDLKVKSFSHGDEQSCWYSLACTARDVVSVRGLYCRGR